MSEPKEVTDLYYDLCKHRAMRRDLPSQTVGDVAHHLYMLGYRKSPTLRVVKPEPPHA